MQDNKYIILQNESIQHEGRTLYRIQAIKDFSIVKSGDKGGFVESEDNLSQSGKCWLYGDSMSYDNAQVFGDATLWFNAIACGDAVVCSRAHCGVDVVVKDLVMLRGDVHLDSNVRVSDNVQISDKVHIIGKDVQISGDVDLSGEVSINGTVKISDNVKLSGNVFVNGNVTICNNTCLSGDETIIGDVVVDSSSSLITFVINDDDYSHTVTYTKSNQRWSLGLVNSVTSEDFLKYERSISEYAYKLAQKYVAVVNGIDIDVIEYIKKSSEKFASITQKYYDNFLKSFNGLPTSVQEQEEIEYWFNRTCTNVDDYLAEMNKSLKQLREITDADNKSLLDAVKCAQGICMCGGRIDVHIEVGNRSIGELL